MKKYLKGNLKRWIAFLLAAVLIVTTCVYSSDASLRANEEGDAAGQTEMASGEQEIASVDVGDQDEPDEEEVSGDQEESDEEEDSGDQDGSGEEEGSGDQDGADVEEGSENQDQPEGEEGTEENPEGDLVDGEVTDEDAVTDPVENPEETPKSPEEEVSGAYSYAIYFYYDGVEDVNARVEKEDGVLGEKILASVNVEEEVTLDGKNYKLDKIENKNGEITEEVKDNVVSVYYVLVEKVDEVPEEDAVYTLELKNTPSEGGKVEVVSVEGEKADGKNAYKENAEVTFEVSVNEGYKLSAVADQTNTGLEAKSQSEKDGIYTYTVTMTEDKVITVTYEKVEDEKIVKVEMPAQTLKASAGAVSVTIDAPEGVLPEGTTVEVSAVGSDDVSEAIIVALAEKELFPTEISAVDITLTKDGEKVSPKGNVTVKLDNVFASDVSGTEAAVYHVNGSSAEYVSSADPSASSVEFTTDHFSVYAAVKAGPVDEYGVATLAETGDKGIKRGIRIVHADNRNAKSFYLETKEVYDEFSWEVEQNDTSVTIEDSQPWGVYYKAGDKPGKASIIHTYGDNKEYWDIVVIPEPEGGMVQRVYIFVQVETDADVDTTGWTLNGSGFYTVGYVDVPTVIIYELGIEEYGKIAEYVKSKLEDELHTVNNTININLSDVEWENFIRTGVSGADEFVNVEKEETWHLDGVIKLTTGSYKVEYYCDDVCDESKSDEITEIIKHDATVIPVDSSKIKDNPFGDEYEFVCYKIGDKEYTALPETVAKDGTIEVHYKSIKKEYEVFYCGGKGSSDPISAGMYKVGDTVTVKAPEGLLLNPEDGIAFAGLWKSSINDETINDKATFTMPENDVYLTAQWKILTINKEKTGIVDKNGKEKDKAGIGDTVKFSITVTNKGDVDLEDIVVTDDGIYVGDELSSNKATIEDGDGYVIKDGSAIIKSLSVGDSVKVNASYVVTKKEVGNPNVVNKATADEKDVEKSVETVPIPMDDVDKQLTVNKEIVKRESATGNTKDEDGNLFYTTDDPVYFKVTVKNTGNVDIENIQVKDLLDDANILEGEGYTVNDGIAHITALSPDDEVIISVEYRIKESDLEKTDFYNTVIARAEDGTEGEGKSKPIHVEKRNPAIKVEKNLVNVTDAQGNPVTTSEVKAGDTINYEIYVENVGNVVLEKIKVTDILNRALGNDVKSGSVIFTPTDGVTIDGNVATIDKLTFKDNTDVKRDIHLSCSYKVTEDDAGRTIKNIVNVKPDGTNIDEKAESKEVEVAKLGYVVNYYYYYGKQLVGEETNKKSYAIYDELIEYITEQTAFGKEYNGEKYMLDKALIGEKVIAEVVGRGEEARLEAEVITATSDNQVIDVYYQMDSNGPDGKWDKIPDSEEYSVIYRSGKNGNEDDRTDGHLYPEGYFVVAEANSFSNSNDSAVFAYWKTDIENVKIIEPGVRFNMPNHDVILTAQWKALRVSKVVDRIIDGENKEKEVANVNDRVDFIITVENVGDIPLKLVVSDDGLSVEGSPVPSNVIIDDNSGYEVSDNQAVINSLAAGGKVEVKAHYIVTENEVGKTNVTNSATAKGDGIEGTDITDPIPMFGVNKWLTVEKEIVDRDKTATGSFENGSDGLRLYTTGDTVRFEVKVTNTGNQTLKDITIEDLLEDATIESGSWLSQIINGYTLTDGKPVINELKPLESATFKASYVIKETDLGKYFYNTVSAKADGQEWKGNSKEIPVDDKKPSVKVEKRLDKIVDADGNEVTGREPKEGDVIHYQIEVENVGNMDIENVRVEDILHVSPEDGIGDRQVTFEEMPGVTIEGNVAIIAKLDRVDTNNNRKITLNCSYQVRRADAGKVIMNGVNVSSDTKKPDGSDLDVEKPKEEVKVTVQRLYTLTVDYVYEAGGTAAPSYVGQYYEGDVYRVDSPVISGYTRVDFVAGEMPKEDLPLRVVYATTVIPPAPGGGDPDPDPDPVDPDTPPVPPVTPVDEGTDPVVPPVDPEVPGGPAVPGAPGTVVITAPAAPALVAVGDAPVPLQGALIETDDDGNVSIIPITEDEIPLANKEIDDHKCCILSFLLMLATLIIYTWFTHSMKKRQKKLAELKDQLAEETLKRQLGITDETSNRR